MRFHCTPSDFITLFQLKDKLFSTGRTQRKINKNKNHQKKTKAIPNSSKLSPSCCRFLPHTPQQKGKHITSKVVHGICPKSPPCLLGASLTPSHVTSSWVTKGLTPKMGGKFPMSWVPLVGIPLPSMANKALALGIP